MLPAGSLEAEACSY